MLVYVEEELLLNEEDCWYVAIDAVAYSFFSIPYILLSAIVNASVDPSVSTKERVIQTKKNKRCQ